MLSGPTLIPSNDAARLAVVRRYDILDTPKDGYFDRITAIAARLFDVPIAIISIVDHDRIWFKSHHGVDASQVGRDPGLCASAILSDKTHIINDAKLDVNVLTNQLVSGALGLRFYAGVPLKTHDGYNLGTLCVIDTQPREITREKIKDLEDLAQVVMDQLELRLSARISLGAKDELLREMNHRIGNSLQLVSSYLMLEGVHDNPDVSRQFNASADRIARLGRVHHRLSRTDNTATIEFSEYLTELCRDIEQSVLVEEGRYRVHVSAPKIELPARVVTPLGIIVNELLTNASKYAFPNGQRGLINVTLDSNSVSHRLTVADDGVGLAHTTESRTEGLGSRLVQSLVQQIRGTLTSSSNSPNGGLRVEVHFPKEI